MFDVYLDRWGLVPDGAPIASNSGHLLPVRRHGRPAMLKVSGEAEERRGSRLMTWWNGEGAARVLAHADDAILLERATDDHALVDLARHGRDDEASWIICATVGQLHASRSRPLPDLVPLDQWFRALAPAAASQGGILSASAAAAHALLADQQDVRVLHGDVHHGNILPFGERGWLAIDPKGLIGERGFDYANLFCNPDHATATVPGRLAHQADVVAEAAGLERTRLLQWILAWAGLSAVWHLDDGTSPETAFAVARLAEAELSR